MTVPHAKIRSALRKIWMYQTTSRVRARARLKRGLYRCESCKNFADAVEVDHSEPIGPTPGSRYADAACTWDRFIERLFCPPDLLNVLCAPCHKAITEKRKLVKAS